MGSSVTHHNAPIRNPVTENKLRICIAGYKISSHTGRARRLCDLIVRKYPDQYENWYYFDSSDYYYFFLKETFDPIPFPEHLKGHSSSPFVWFEKNKNEIEPIGGRSHFAEWAIKTFPNDQEIFECASTSWTCGDIFHN